jgi:hypothetical protein
MALDIPTGFALIYDPAGVVSDSENLYGINATESQVIADTVTVTINVCVEGDVSEDFVFPQSQINYLRGANWAIRLVKFNELSQDFS